MAQRKAQVASVHRLVQVSAARRVCCVLDYDFDQVRILVWFYPGWCCVLARQRQPQPPAKPKVHCPDCGSQMELVAITSASGAILHQRGQTFLDSS